MIVLSNMHALVGTIQTVEYKISIIMSDELLASITKLPSNYKPFSSSHLCAVVI